MKPMNHVEELKRFLNFVDVDEFLNKVDNFRNIDLQSIPDQELFNAINKVLTFKTDNGDELRFPSIMGVYPKGTKFFRVRNLEPDDTIFPLRGMKIEQDALNPPNDVIKVRGRLNTIHESLLYVSPGDPTVAIKEARINEDEHFSLIVYTAKEEVKVNRIGFFENNRQLNGEENIKLRLLMNFLRDEFTRDVGKGTEFLYRISERITKDYFDLPPRVFQDAWCYPSIAKKGSFNVCFRPEIARDLLELQGVIICKLINDNFLCKAIASGFDEKGIFRYHLIGSPMQKMIFPEIQ